MLNKKQADSTKKFWEKKYQKYCNLLKSCTWLPTRKLLGCQQGNAANWVEGNIKPHRAPQASTAATRHQQAANSGNVVTQKSETKALWILGKKF